MSIPISTSVSNTVPSLSSAAAAQRYVLPRKRTHRVDAGLRRLLDVTVSLAVLLFLLPVLALIALLIKLGSPGPVLFIQKRVGRDGREFPVYKFRSMYTDAEHRLERLLAENERSGPVFKMRQDPRVTRIGRILRRGSLDEFPQLLNVLRGEMSLVGPRPAIPREVALYTPMQRGRLAVTPGLTGLWQVSGRANLSFEESIALDLEYIERQSFGLNLILLARTVPAVLTGHGAY